MTDQARPVFGGPLNTGGTPVAARPSATVVVARDGAAGVEVFMLERHLNSDFAGGAYVFPGGTVEERDCDPALRALCDGLPDDAAARYGSEPGAETGFPICAIRETFEEAGVLLARRDGEVVRWDATEEQVFAEARRALAARELTPLDFAREFRLRFAVDLMGYWDRWVTPEFAPKRYDARFFVATLPAGQEPIHDDVETTASVWVRPEDALERARRGELSIIFPTRKTLEALSGHGRAADLLGACPPGEIEPILPRIVLRDGQPKVLLPNDPTEHDP